ncbi:autotransporter domain-containing protein [Rhizobium sp. CFBP 8762]|uniref:autotransporter outer membrane beta-barrel domain-containing protein n=1 Tax=Rhizobium sp. CFBP 8762 TaxID=2775279 RepID=UPI0017866F27|nr:autotransporter domain-containing protein [Rhizobium sp. CFBP 8762]MBD8554670.1 autotransporter domain-containing protein [Rhizobium sp. CFBP 8762]
MSSRSKPRLPTLKSSHLVGVLLTSAAFFPAASSKADVDIIFSGDLTNQPTYHRVNIRAQPPRLSRAGTNVNYIQMPFTTIGDGVLQISADSALDNYGFLYAPFNPADALANLITGDDDPGFVENNYSYSSQLVSGNRYVAVTTSYNNGEQGPVSVRMSSTGSVDGIVLPEDLVGFEGTTTINRGILQISADSRLGSGSGGLVFNGGTLRFGSSFDLADKRSITLNAGGGTFDTFGNTATIARAITGVGALTKAGLGVLTLSGANTYTGETAIASGTLALAGDGRLNSSSRIIADGTFDISGSDHGEIASLAGSGSVLLGDKTLTLQNAADDFSGTIAGVGQVAIADGTQTLSGTNTFIGGIAVSQSATLQVGNGGGGGSIVSDVSNDGTLIFNAAGNALYSGVITGDGTVEQTGAGTLVLTGQNLTTGTVRIGTGSALQLGNGGTIGFLNANGFNNTVENNGTLIYNRSDNIVLNTGVGGTGSLIKAGSGILTVTGANTYTGQTQVASGILDVIAGGSLASSSLLTVENGARLHGNGTVGSVLLNAGSTIAPGNSIGTLQVAGDLTFTPGSSYEVEVDPEGTASDLVTVDGVATLNGASVVHVGTTGNYRPVSTYTILTADGGVVGQFGGATSVFAFLDPILGYTADTVTLSLVRNNISFTDVGLTRNQIATAGGLESLGMGNAIYDAIVALPGNGALIRNSFDQLSGEIHASTKTALIDDSHIVRDAVYSRLYTASGTAEPAAWSYAVGEWGTVDGDGNASEMDHDARGIIVGGDAPVSDNWRLGALFGYTRSSFDVDARRSNGDSDNIHLGVYGSGEWGAVSFRSGLAYTFHDIDGTRTVAIPGLSSQLRNDYDADTFQAFGELGYRFNTQQAVIEPFVSLAHVRLNTDSFTEEGGLGALRVRGDNTDTTFTTVGVRASTDLNLGQQKASLVGTLGWRHAYGDTTPLSTHRFAGGDAFTVAGVPIAKNAAIVEAGVDFDISTNAKLGVSYKGQFGDGTRRNGAALNLSVKF